MISPSLLAMNRMADRSTSLERLLVREIERRLELEKYCSSLEAELRHEKFNNIVLRHMVRALSLYLVPENSLRNVIGTSSDLWVQPLS